MIIRYLQIFGCCFLLLSSSVASADVDAERHSVGRYVQERLAPTEAEKDPLQAKVFLDFPRSVRTVRQAVDHALARSGYQVDWSASEPTATNRLGQLPLPEVHRRIGHASIFTILQTLLGSPWRIRVDQINRTLLIQRAHLAHGTPAAESAWEVDALVDPRISSGDMQEPVVVHEQSVPLNQLLAQLVPSGWSVEFHISEEKQLEELTFHAETTREEAISSLLQQLGYKGIPYSASGILVVTEGAQ